MVADDVLDTIQQDVIAARKGVPILEEWDPKAASIAASGLTLLEEGLDIIRSLRGNPEQVRAELAARCEKFIQELAAARFGKKEDT